MSRVKLIKFAYENPEFRGRVLDFLARKAAARDVDHQLNASEARNVENEVWDQFEKHSKKGHGFWTHIGRMMNFEDNPGDSQMYGYDRRASFEDSPAYQIYEPYLENQLLLASAKKMVDHWKKKKDQGEVDAWKKELDKHEQESGDFTKALSSGKLEDLPEKIQSRISGSWKSSMRNFIKNNADNSDPKVKAEVEATEKEYVPEDIKKRDDDKKRKDREDKATSKLTESTTARVKAEVQKAHDEQMKSWEGGGEYKDIENPYEAERGRRSQLMDRIEDAMRNAEDRVEDLDDAIRDASSTRKPALREKLKAAKKRFSELKKQQKQLDNRKDWDELLIASKAFDDEVAAKKREFEKAKAEKAKQPKEEPKKEEPKQEDSKKESPASGGGIPPHVRDQAKKEKIHDPETGREIQVNTMEAKPNKTPRQKEELRSFWDKVKDFFRGKSQEEKSASVSGREKLLRFALDNPSERNRVFLFLMDQDPGFDKFAVQLVDDDFEEDKEAGMIHMVHQHINRALKDKDKDKKPEKTEAEKEAERLRNKNKYRSPSNNRRWASQLAKRVAFVYASYNSELYTQASRFLNSHQTALDRGIEVVGRKIQDHHTNRDLQQLFKQLHKDLAESKKSGATLRRAISNNDMDAIHQVVTSFDEKMKQIERFGSNKQKEFSRDVLKKTKREAKNFGSGKNRAEVGKTKVPNPDANKPGQKDEISLNRLDQKNPEKAKSWWDRLMHRSSSYTYLPGFYREGNQYFYVVDHDKTQFPDKGGMVTYWVKGVPLKDNVATAQELAYRKWQFVNVRNVPPEVVSYFSKYI